MPEEKNISQDNSTDSAQVDMGISALGKPHSSAEEFIKSDQYHRLEAGEHDGMLRRYERFAKILGIKEPPPVFIYKTDTIGNGAFTHDDCVTVDSALIDLLT